MSVILTSKGQTTIPKEIRDRLNLKAGDRLEFVIDSDGRVVLVPATVPVTRLKGILPKPKSAATLKEMDEAVRKGAVSRVMGTE